MAPPVTFGIERKRPRVTCGGTPQDTVAPERLVKDQARKTCVKSRGLQADFSSSSFRKCRIRCT
jgi:hypothetical protein